MELVFVLLLGIAALGVAGFTYLFRAEAAQKKAEANADALLDEMFDGRPTVSVQLHVKSLKYATVVEGATARGYRVLDGSALTNGYGTIVFERVTTRAA